jgi:conjugal transfer mating pair stabilization protein TraN
MRATTFVLTLSFIVSGQAYSGTCALKTSQCVEGPETRTIGGQSVFKDCWRYRKTYECLDSRLTEEPYCQELRNAGCVQIGSTCVSSYENRCVEYENVYQCGGGTGTQQVVMNCGAQIYCLDWNCFDSGYPPNSDLALVAAHVGALNAMNDDIDPDTLEIFKGEDMRCSKATLSFSNCCKDDGWGQDIGLAQCTESEKMLGERKQAGLCHQVGSYCSKEVLGVCTSRKYTYCCFTSKIGRIIQEQGRPQLGWNWGTPQAPDCRGITPEELQRLDFSRMDFTEFYEDALAGIKDIDPVQLQKDIEQKVENMRGQQ